MKFTQLHFLHLFFAGIIAGMAYVHYRYVRLLAKNPVKRTLLGCFLFSPVAAVFLSFAMKLKGQSGLLPDLVAWHAYLGLGFLSFLFFLLLLKDAVLVSAGMASKLANQNKGHGEGCSKARIPSPLRRFFTEKRLAHSLAGAAVLLSLAGIYNAHKTPDVVEIKLPVKNLPRDLEGFSIVQITDIHLGPTLKRPFLEKIVRRVNSLSPDVVVLTGDLVDGFVDELGDDIKPLKNLRSSHGNYFVTGNHEYYFRALDWIGAVSRLDFKVLSNSHDLVRRGEGRILFAGVPDLKAETFFPSHRPDPLKAVKDAPAAHVKILLAHQPKAVEQAAEAGFHVQISGHTHGGQLFPWNYIIALNQNYLAGVYVHEGVRLYVSRGAGYWGPPMRFFAPSEITRFVLVAG